MKNGKSGFEREWSTKRKEKKRMLIKWRGEY